MNVKLLSVIVKFSRISIIIQIIFLRFVVNGTAQSTQPITSITNQSAASIAACAAAAATGCPGTPSPVTQQTEPLSATAAAVFAATGIHPAAYAGST